MGANWITFNKTSGTGGGSIEVSAMGNVGPERNADVEISTASQTKTLSVLQNGIPVIGSLRIHLDPGALIKNITFANEYGITFPVIEYEAEGASQNNRMFCVLFNFDNKYIHDVNSYLRKNYPEETPDSDWLAIRHNTPTGENLTYYTEEIPETGRSSLQLNDIISNDLEMIKGSEVELCIPIDNENFYVSLYRIKFV